MNQSSFLVFKFLFIHELKGFVTELTKSIVKVLVLGFLSCIGIGIVKSIFQVLVLVLVLLRDFSKYWYWYWYC